MSNISSTQFSLTNKLWKSRGISSDEKTLFENFLSIHGKKEEDFSFPKFSDFCSPFLFQDMEKAVKLIENSIENNERILIFGDYDLDGMSGTAVLFLTLKHLGANVSYRLPCRDDGYGLSKFFIEEAFNNQVKLFITTDCGVSNLEEISLAKQLGITTIITDHHSVGDELPVAEAILHPLVKNEPFPDKDLTGAGVAWYFCRAMLQKKYGEKKSEAMEKELLEIALLGTIADCGALQGENRKIVMIGLEKIKTTKNNALLKLIEISGSKKESLTAETIAFFIAPRLNASGRLAHPRISLELLLGNAERAMELEELNKKRQKLVEGFLEEAMTQIQEQEDSPALLVGSKDWPGGIIGLISGRLAEQFGKPSIAFEIKKDKITGSCRGPQDFDIATTLKEIQKKNPEFFYGCGGHAQAAGLSLYPEHFESFCSEYRVVVNEKRGDTPPLPTIEYFGEIKKEISTDEIKDLQKAQPFGIGNPFPSFLFSSVTILKVRTVGSDDQHLSLYLQSPFSQQPAFSAIWFREGDKFSDLEEGMQIDIVAVPEINVWKDQEKISLKVVDVRL